ncbi:MAG TPA: TIGR03619 family F420-dependent LLM class oxidoreductase [Acidimicrobiales bacterium]|nr:TIGR03619 family F420-dependent LLM class oxidoreductase [Acidimicrobiales bacterium]
MPIVPEGQLAYGMQLPIQAQSTMFVAEWERDAGPDELVAITRAAEEAGFFYVAVCDHVSVPERLAPAMGTTWYDPISTLGLLAGVTSRIRLMSHVWVLPYRHPLVSAKAFATLDHLSKGRVIVGVGAGHVPEEFETLGVPFDHRGRLLDEAIDALKVALSEEFPSFAGPTWTFAGGGARPRPVQQPRPPIWVGGSSPAAVRRAGERGDGWLPQGTPKKDMPEQIATLREYRARVGGEPVEIGAISLPFLYVGSPSWDVGPGVKAGSPDAVAASLLEFKEMGVSHVQIRFKVRSCDELLDQIGQFGADVAPLLV